MEGSHRPILQSGFKIDQQVAAGDQVKFRKWRIARHIVSRKHAHVADSPDHDVPVALGVNHFPARSGDNPGLAMR